MKICLYDSGLGVLPFIKLILRNNLGNDYYIFLDQDNFPYGEKSEEELEDVLIKNLNEINKNKYDLIFILCNTMSFIYKKLNIKQDNIKTILDVNINYQTDEYFLCTSALSNKLPYSLSGGSLASYIEKVNILEIINFINDIDKKVILSCTHYHLLKDIIPFYKKEFESLEKEIFKDLNYNSLVNFYVKKKDYDVIRKYLKRVLYFY